MGLVDLIKRMWQPRQLEDPFFGPLRSYEPGLWDGRRFAPTGVTVELTLDANRAGPTELCRQFCRDLEERYSTLLQQIEPLRLQQLECQLGEQSKRWGWSAPRLDGVSLPDPASRPWDWELTCQVESAPLYLFYLDVRLHGWEPQEVEAQRDSTSE